MKGILAVLSLFLLLPVIDVRGETAKEGLDFCGTVTEKAIWTPDDGALKALLKECREGGGSDFGRCFVSRMEKAGATPEAVIFAGCIRNEGFLHGLRRVGPVDVAYVTYPFRANENYGCFLVNGDPALVDVDMLGFRPPMDMLADPAYRGLKERFPGITLWPGDRYGADCAVPGHGENSGAFVVRYRLLNGCHACELLGYARFAFPFDAKGRFLGVRFLGVDDVPPPPPPGQSR